MMTRRPMTWGRWLEIVCGAVLPTVLLVPWIALILIGGVIDGAMFHFSWRDRGLWALYLMDLGAVASLWLLILFGPEQVMGRRVLGGFVFLAGIVGLSHGLRAIYQCGFSFPPDRWIFFRAAFIGPVVVGLRYLVTWLIKRVSRR